MSLRIWENLPEEYRASDDPYEVLNLWRGDIKRLEQRGFRHHLHDRSIDPEQMVYESLFVKYPNLKTMVKRHTNSSGNSPFVSLTGSLELAQKFSGGCVYNVQIPAHRLVLSPANSEEIRHIEPLAIGSVLPEEIVSVEFVEAGIGE